MSEQQLSDVAAAELTTVLGGEEIEVDYQDGKKERILVRQLPVKDLQRFWSLLNDEEAATALVCDREPTWCARLKRDSYQVLADKAQEINLPFFRPWVRRQLRWQEAANPSLLTGFKAALDVAVEQVSRSQGS